MKLVRSAALAVMMGAAPSALAQPVFPVSVEVMDIGVGLPDGQTMDVAGFYPGQPADEAFATAQEFYAAQGANPPYVVEASLEFADTPFILGIGPSGMMRTETYDDVYAVFSTNGSGNQLVTLFRDVRYGSEYPNADATLQAIIDKYGPPGSDSGEFRENSARVIEYGFLDGAAKTGDGVICPSLNALRTFQPRNGHDLNTLRQLTFRAAENNLNVYNPQDRCDVYLRIEIGPGYENGRNNPDIVGSMKMFVIDAARFESANARDNAAQRELQELAAGQRSQGAGAPKL
ncbi:hypothetical protein [uncultured Devosia sp.]|uniref:hypothetical protein n=1 Tax=uncultured Devosia sp. TaxID=211434 RepID=UPI00260A0FC6|nr:hypothetical protein [uncultured Devosia sp.]